MTNLHAARFELSYVGDTLRPTRAIHHLAGHCSLQGRPLGRGISAADEIRRSGHFASEGHMFTRLRHGLTPTLLMGLATCAVLFGASSLVSEASPLLQTPPLLGNAASFAVLGGSTVTNTGPTI